MNRLAMRILTSKGGQAMTEYVVVMFGAVLGLIGFSLTFRRAIAAYIAPIYFSIAMPIP